MSTQLVVERRSPLPVPAKEAFAWHARPGALERLTPPWVRIRVLERTAGGLEPGSRVRIRARVPWLPPYTTIHEHPEVEPDRGFTDIQVQGPFDRWIHRHSFEPDPVHPGRSFVHDHITCELPLGMRLGRNLALRELERLLGYRHSVTAADLAMHAGAKTAGVGSLRVGITGASGFIGSLLIPVLTTGGHQVTRFVRRPPRGEQEIQWGDGSRFSLDPQALAGLDAVVHLAGENIARRWTESRKQAILESRRDGTRVIAEAMAQARSSGGPRVLVSTSAVGIYGDRGDDLLTEASAPGRGFLPEVATAWEQATESAEVAGVRVVRLRIGLPLTPSGGLLARMLPAFRLGVGGRLGSGRQWMSWLSADDLLEIFHRVLTRDTMRGPVNTVGPNPLRNSDLTRTLARILHRPAVMVAPRTVLRLIYGSEMADEALLASARVEPYVLQGMGHTFRHPTLEGALGHVLGRGR
ncbi:MAG: TIGR01777 family oxidoreductase [Gemmatimonadales bacterium]